MFAFSSTIATLLLGRLEYQLFNKLIDEKIVKIKA